MADLRLDAVSYQYPGSERPVLDGFTADFAPGRCWWLSGQNGAGKTTLLEICAGLRHPTAGEVRLGDAPVDAARAQFLPAELPVFPELTVVEHAAIVSELWQFAGSTRDSFTARFFEIIAGLGLERRHERLAQFSTGMREKVALALTLARPGDLVLLDEPFSALDAPSLAHCQEMIREEASARVVVIVSHIPDIVKPLLPNHVRLPEGVLS